MNTTIVTVVGLVEGGSAAFKPLYGDDLPLADTIRTTAREIMAMPGLPRIPAANKITLNAEGQIEGLF